MRQFVLVCGIGGSGTSLTCSILEKLGYEFGRLNCTRRIRKSHGVQGYYESLVLGRVIKLWNWAEGDGRRFGAIDNVPVTNTIRGRNPLKRLLAIYADQLLKRELMRNRNRELFAMKRPDSLWWSSRISKIAQGMTLPRPMMLFCDRNSEDLLHNRFDASGANYLHSRRYADNCRTQYEHIARNKREIAPATVRIVFEDYTNAPDRIAHDLSTFLHVDPQDARRAQ